MKRMIFTFACAWLYLLSIGINAAETAPSPQATLKSYLMQKAKTQVTLHLSSGKELSGTVGTLGQHLVQIKNLKGKEFFDAMVPYDNIVAIEVRNR